MEYDQIAWHLNLCPFLDSRQDFNPQLFFTDAKFWIALIFLNHTVFFDLHQNFNPRRFLTKHIFDPHYISCPTVPTVPMILRRFVIK